MISNIRQHNFRILTWLFGILLMSISNGISGQTDNVDSLEQLLEVTHESKERIEIFTALSKKYQTIDLTNAKGYARKALNLSDNTGIGEFKAEIFGCLGDIAIMEDSVEVARQYYETSLVLFDEASDFYGLAGVTLVLGNIANIQNYLPEAMLYYRQAIKYAELAGLTSWMDNLYANMGSLSLQAGNYEEAQKLFAIALDKASAQGDSLVMSNSYSNLGLTNIAIKDTAQARRNILKAMELGFQMGNTTEIAQNYISLAKLENSYGKYRNAIEDLRKSEYYLAQDAPNYAGPKAILLSEINLRFAQNYLAIDEIDSARYYFYLALSSGKLNGQLEFVAKAAQGLSKIYDEQSDIDSAFFYFRMFKKFSDSIVNEDNIRKLAYQDANFRHEQKTIQDELKREQELIRNKKNRTIFIIIILGLILALIVLILFLQLGRNRVKRIELEQINLKNELEIRNKELTTHVIYQLKKNEFILNIISKLKGSVRNLLPENKKLIEGVIQELDMDAGAEVWKEFEVRFQQVHNDFYKNLVKKYPDLTANELRLSAFLKLNMNTKDIAAITYQSTNSIDVARSRLRQKFGLTKEENLIAFLSSF